MSLAVNRITDIRRRSSSLPDAIGAFSQGEYDRALALVHGLSGAPAIVLQARILQRMGQNAKALKIISTARHDNLSVSERAEITILQSAINLSLGEFEIARDNLDLARVLAFSATVPSVEIDYFYNEAQFSAIGDRDYDSAVASAHEALSVERSQGQSMRSGISGSVEISRARAFHLIGFVAGIRASYSEQAAWYRKAFDEYEQSQVIDVGLGAFFAQSLSFLVRDFDFPKDAARLRDFVNKATWPSDLDYARHHIYRALGWDCVFNGNHIGAFREFRKASSFAPTVPLKILASVDRAFLSRELGEATNALDEIEFAADLADRVSWTDAAEEVIALVLLSQEVAAIDVDRANRLFERYRSAKQKIPANYMNVVDRRPRAYERMAEGFILKNAGSRSAAASAFLDAFEIWDGLGYTWRAATAALELVELTTESRYYEYVQQEALKRPHSWISMRLARS